MNDVTASGAPAPATATAAPDAASTAAPAIPPGRSAAITRLTNAMKAHRDWQASVEAELEANIGAEAEVKRLNAEVTSLQNQLSALEADYEDKINQVAAYFEQSTPETGASAVQSATGTSPAASASA